MAQVDVLGASKPLSNPHPVREILQVADSFYVNQTKLILEQNAKNDENMHKLELINDVLGLIQNNRATPLNFDTDEARQLVEAVREGTPKALPADFLDKVATYSEADWDRIEDTLMNQEKPLMSGFNLTMLEIEQLFNDRNRVFDIVSEILKEYREGTRVFIRGQRGGQ